MTAALELPDRLRKRIAVLGHHLALFAEALTALRGRAEKGRLPEPLTAHVRLCLDWLPQAAMPASFEVMLRVPESAPDDWTVTAAESPSFLSAAACTLLHLPGLRRMWGGWLRGNVLADLRRRLPRAWVLDHAAVPPYGAIAGLGLSAWAEWARLRSRGRTFEIRLAQEESALVLTPSSDEDIWREAARRLGATLPGRALIAELPGGAPPLWRAGFAQQNERWEMTSLQAED